MNRRMAFCIYGQPRTMEFCFPSIKKHILDVYHPDVFICSDSQGDRIRELYNPVAMEIHSVEEENELMGERRLQYGLIQHNNTPYPKFPTQDLSVMFKTWRCGEMMKEHERINGVYDITSGSRFDSKYLSIEPIHDPQENTIYLPRVDANQGAADVRGVHWGTGYSTHFWYGTSVIGRMLLDSYNWSDEHYQATQEWNTEKALKWRCDKDGIKIHYIEVRFMLIRGTNELPCAAGVEWLPLSPIYYPEYL
jgi:hypothetical protein